MGARTRASGHSAASCCSMKGHPRFDDFDLDCLSEAWRSECAVCASLLRSFPTEKRHQSRYDCVDVQLHDDDVLTFDCQCRYCHRCLYYDCLRLRRRPFFCQLEVNGLNSCGDVVDGDYYDSHVDGDLSTNMTASYCSNLNLCQKLPKSSLY